MKEILPQKTSKLLRTFLLNTNDKPGVLSELLTPMSNETNSFEVNVVMGIDVNGIFFSQKFAAILTSTKMTRILKKRTILKRRRRRN